MLLLLYLLVLLLLLFVIDITYITIQHTPLVPNYPLSYLLQSCSHKSVSYMDAPGHTGLYILTVILVLGPDSMCD